MIPGPKLAECLVARKAAACRLVPVAVLQMNVVDRLSCRCGRSSTGSSRLTWKCAGSIHRPHDAGVEQRPSACRAARASPRTCRGAGDRRCRMPMPVCVLADRLQAIGEVAVCGPASTRLAQDARAGRRHTRARVRTAALEEAREHLDLGELARPQLRHSSTHRRHTSPTDECRSAPTARRHERHAARTSRCRARCVAPGTGPRVRHRRA